MAKVYAVLEKQDYQLVNIHATLDEALAQVARLSHNKEYQPHIYFDPNEGKFMCADNVEYVVRVYHLG